MKKITINKNEFNLDEIRFFTLKRFYPVTLPEGCTTQGARMLNVICKDRNSFMQFSKWGRILTIAKIILVYLSVGQFPMFKFFGSVKAPKDGKFYTFGGKEI